MIRAPSISLVYSHYHPNSDNHRGKSLCLKRNHKFAQTDYHDYEL